METRNTRERPLEQLDLHAPLKSARRSSSSADTISMSYSNSIRVYSTDASQGVPFVWESSPGVPKEAGRAGLSSNGDNGPLPPKPPPSQWRPSGEDSNANGKHQGHGHDDGNDSDVDNCSDGTEDGDVFSDALEEISLSESLAIAHRLSSCHIEATVDRAPSFIMNRFLPAATALANSSATTTRKHCYRRAPPSCSHQSQREPTKMRTRHRAHDARLQVPYFPHAEARTDVPSKACGLMFFFPWSLKPMVCGFKSLGRCRTSRANLSASPRKTMEGLSDGLSSDVEDDGGGCDDKLSIKACHSPGWGLPFLDISRLRKGGRGVDRGKAKEICVPEQLGSKCARSQNRAGGGGGASERKRTVWSLPQLRSPTESWLSNVLDSNSR
ncbi:uncharacterized protein LOC103718826 [Phoenix dactylifera]|uniref:Uncharacterized protein LOC103718826 n=1 Tax=Phoenix dactylifera TaxID=42345 RepID=A0A8B7CTJ0_PHODC|nr:uncharacterized protein LOC103718826 [Phoenix dactylifera]